MKKEVNGIQTEKEVKLLLFADDMILCIEYTKDATRTLLELINNLLKLKNTKLIQRNLLHFYTCYANNKRSEREIQEAISFTIASKSIKYLGINLPKETKDLYSKNCKTLMKEIEEDINR